MGGVRNIVAPQGTAFTPEHARILKRYVDEVVLCFDSDNAGQNAASHALDSLLAVGLGVRVATVPTPHDPDSFIKENGGGAFQELINKAEGFFDFYLNRLCTTNDSASDSGRMQIVRSMGEAVLKTNSAVLIDTYAQKTGQRLGVKAESVLAEFRKIYGPKPVAPEENELAPAPEQAPPPKPEFWLLRFILAGDEHVSWAAQNLDLNWLSHPGVREILRARFNDEQENNWRGIPALLERFEDPAVRGLLAQAVAEDFPKKNLDVQIMKAVEEMRNAYIERELAALNQRLVQPNLTQEEMVAIIQEKSRLWALNKTRYSKPKSSESV
jgi:DNA primase